MVEATSNREYKRKRHARFLVSTTALLGSSHNAFRDKPDNDCEEDYMHVSLPRHLFCLCMYFQSSYLIRCHFLNPPKNVISRNASKSWLIVAERGAYRRRGTPRKIRWGCAVRFAKPIPYLRPKSKDLSLKSKPRFRPVL